MKTEPNTAVHELMEGIDVTETARDHPDGELYFDTGAAVDEMESE
jgi:hypothetical protein